MLKYHPDFNQFLKVLRRERPSRPVLYEFLFDSERFLRPAADPDARQGESLMPDNPAEDTAWANLGYDYRQLFGSTFTFPGGEQDRKDTKSLNEGSVIANRADFEKYEWPDPERFDYSGLEKARPPEGMKYLVFGPCGVLENAIALAGFDRLCFMLADEPDLARDLFDAVGSRLLRYYELCAPYDNVGGLVINDDWGFKTQTMISPAQLRQYVVPWHRKMVAVAHAAGKPAILHSCGQLETVMGDLINLCRFDAKHSFEDTILPVEQAYDRWGGRIGILGGMDVDFVCRGTPEAIKARARSLIARTGCRGYALGTGNSVPRYMPVENYRAMTEAALESRR